MRSDATRGGMLGNRARRSRRSLCKDAQIELLVEATFRKASGASNLFPLRSWSPNVDLETYGRAGEKEADIVAGAGGGGAGRFGGGPDGYGGAGYVVRLGLLVSRPVWREQGLDSGDYHPESSFGGGIGGFGPVADEACSCVVGAGIV
jgi:hypothetical protein